MLFVAPCIKFPGGLACTAFPFQPAGGPQIRSRASVSGRSRVQVRSCTTVTRWLKITGMAASPVCCTAFIMHPTPDIRYKALYTSDNRAKGCCTSIRLVYTSRGWSLTYKANIWKSCYAVFCSGLTEQHCVICAMT